MTESIGLYAKPPADRELSSENVRDVVREQFPDLAVTTVETLGDGWENDTYLVDNHVVFQFPRQAGGDYFEWEERMHTFVSSVIGDLVGIPRITRWGQPSAWFPYRFAGYELIPGVPANDPSVRLNPALADDIGRVLARLHAIPVEAAVAADVYGLAVDKSDLAAGLTQVRRWVNDLPEIRQHVPDACAWLDSASRAPEVYRGPPRFIHDDFQMEHVLVNLTTGRLSGIIDWGGGFGDPMRDFSYVLLHGGWSFFQRAVRAYDLPLDSEFAERTLFSARLGSLGWLADAVKRGENTARYAATVRRVLELE
jgi:aminoglycoside phosphotransferase (APT) family kinase protein